MIEDLLVCLLAYLVVGLEVNIVVGEVYIGLFTTFFTIICGVWLSWEVSFSEDWVHCFLDIFL